MNHEHFITAVDETISKGVEKGILHLIQEGNMPKNNEIVINGSRLINFTSCSYLGLEHDIRLRQAAIDNINEYGTQFSESRAYVSIQTYKELEELMTNIFDAPTIIAPTTTLAHLSAVPVLLNSNDAVIVDQQLHNSVLSGINIFRANWPMHFEVLRHNRMDLLEDKVKLLQAKHKRVWFFADGIYSMFGDQCPVETIVDLLNRYPAFHTYIDDAHGMSILGNRGKGSVLGTRNIHEKMIVASSMAKAFACCGGILVFPNKDLARKVRTCGAPFNSSGPLQPATLGAAVACAKIHLTDEIYSLQAELSNRIQYANSLFRKTDLPLVSNSEGAIFFVGTSKPELAYDIMERMMKRGFLLNIGVFPAVSQKNSGIRFTITTLQTYEQIKNMIEALEEEFIASLKNNNYSLEQINDAFKTINTSNSKPNGRLQLRVEGSPALTLEHYGSISQINKNVWDNTFEDAGFFTHEVLRMLEKVFGSNNVDINKWLFDYVLIKDMYGKVVLATFLTSTIWKDDVFADSQKSIKVERIRKVDPGFLMSKVIATGSLISEGPHLFIDKKHPLYQQALKQFISFVQQLYEERELDSIILRDFYEFDQLLDQTLTNEGFLRVNITERHIVQLKNVSSEHEFYSALSKRSQQHFREDVRKYFKAFHIEYIDTPENDVVKKIYTLYSNVFNKSLAINSHLLPLAFVTEFTKLANSECILLRHYMEDGSLNEEIIGAILCYKTKKAYIPLVIGMNYNYLKPLKIYKQSLYQTVKRAFLLNKENVLMGFGAPIEKKKMKAKAIKAFGYFLFRETYNLDILSNI
ncbi:MAG: aminotransferase class I/II-fold pyridoxal phosphate-dependent enzyme [Niabella sp.]